MSTDPPVVAGVLLAAGASERFGDRNKLLASVDGQPVVTRAAATLVAADLEDVVAVVGHEAERVRAALDGLALRAVANPAFREGQSTSLRAGVAAVAEGGADAAVVALGDMPWVDPGTVRALRDAYRRGAGDALAAAYRGERGNPALFDARHFPALRAVEGDAGGRAILRAEGTLVETGDPGVRRDVDVPADLPSE